MVSCSSSFFHFASTVKVNLRGNSFAHGFTIYVIVERKSFSISLSQITQNPLIRHCESLSLLTQQLCIYFHFNRELCILGKNILFSASRGKNCVGMPFGRGSHYFFLERRKFLQDQLMYIYRSN